MNMTSSGDGLERWRELVGACSDPLRLRLLRLLAGREEVCVCHLHEALEAPQPTVSRHLAVLRRCRVVLGRKLGLWVYYRLAGGPGRSREVEGLAVRDLLTCLAAKLGEPAEFVDDQRRLERLLRGEEVPLVEIRRDAKRPR